MSTTDEQPPRLPALVAGGEIKAIVPQSFEDAWRIANVVAKAGLAPRGLESPEKCMVAIMHGMELGMLPMAALQSIAVINNRPSVFGDGLLGLVRRSGQMEWIKETFTGEGETLTAVCTIQRKGEAEPIISTFSVAQAKLAGLWERRGKNGDPTPWQTYPSRMLKMRARAYALRDGYADVLRGLSVAEEQEDVERMVDVTPPRDDTPPAPPPGPPAAPPAAPEPVAPADVAQTWEDAPEPPQPVPGAEAVASASGASDDEPFDPETGEVMEEEDLIPPLPPILDRRPAPPELESAADVQGWLDELENAFSGCEDGTALVDEQRARMAPRKGKVSVAAWKQAEAILNNHVMRLRP